MAKILIAGATGFIGRRIILRLLEKGHEIYALSRIRGIELKFASSFRFHYVYGDLGIEADTPRFPKEIDAAYYLVHSMGKLVQNLIEEEETSARNFIRALGETNCKQVIYLGGIIEDESRLSPHLQGRLAVENVLCSGPVPVTVLRASLIIGSGSASFEIIRDLVEKLPLMVAPKWVLSLCQPIAIRDVLFYLESILLDPRCYGEIYDIGGPEVLSFREVLLRYAAFRGLKRLILNIPLLTPRLSSYWLVLITSVRFSICSYLVESMKHNTRKLNRAIDSLFPHTCLDFEQALELAFQKISQNEVVSTWMDSWDLKSLKPSIEEFIEAPVEGCLINSQIIPLQISIEAAKDNIWSVGGEKGWGSMNWAWRIRGLIDQLVGGTGLNRGRRHPTEIEVGDSIDFWRVLLADRKRGHLILFAQMKLPGEAWLEFRIDEKAQALIQTATFRPRGFLGRIYWYALWPFHVFIFRNMALSLVK